MGFGGKCDGALEAHAFSSKSVDVAIYVEKTDLGTGAFRRVPMGVVVVAKPRLDAARAPTPNRRLRAHIEPPSPDEHADATCRNDVDLRGLAAAIAAAAGTDDFSLKHSQVISRGGSTRAALLGRPGRGRHGFVLAGRQDGDARQARRRAFRRRWARAPQRAGR